MNRTNLVLQVRTVYLLATEGHYTIGGADQAWYYWRDAGELWEQVPGAIDFVRVFLKG
jgi:hypothetical protein